MKLAIYQGTSDPMLRMVDDHAAGKSHGDDIDLLREIIAQGGKKHTPGLIDRSGYQRLVDVGWLDAFRTNAQDVLYEVTKAGRLAGKAIG